MMSCWRENPEDRPSFDELEEILSKMYLNDDINEGSLRALKVDKLNWNPDETEESDSSSGYESPA